MPLSSERPQCPGCGIAMIIIRESHDAKGHADRVFECLRCGRIEKPEMPKLRYGN
jgi:hypothetical protein